MLLVRLRLRLLRQGGVLRLGVGRGAAGPAVADHLAQLLVVLEQLLLLRLQLRGVGWRRRRGGGEHGAVSVDSGAAFVGRFRLSSRRGGVAVRRQRHAPGRAGEHARPAPGRGRLGVVGPGALGPRGVPRARRSTAAAGAGGQPSSVPPRLLRSWLCSRHQYQRRGRHHHAPHALLRRLALEAPFAGENGVDGRNCSLTSPFNLF
mmetsp:Transcript_13676/g.48553  ORF Transcript_13676/g.48553 Transcript_13676/m.48553 type:complete len:205 (-) Transcript_13676:949-1563(-)